MKKEDIIFQPRRQARPTRYVILGFYCPTPKIIYFCCYKQPRLAFCMVDIPKIIAFCHDLVSPSKSEGHDNVDSLVTFSGTYCHISTGLLYTDTILVLLFAIFVPSLFPPRIKSKGTSVSVSLIFFPNLFLITMGKVRSYFLFFEHTLSDFKR